LRAVNAREQLREAFLRQSFDRLLQLLVRGFGREQPFSNSDPQVAFIPNVQDVQPCPKLAREVVSSLERDLSVFAEVCRHKNVFDAHGL
jgi:hypothetical protein